MDSRGNEPVANFLESLPIEVQVKVFRLIDLLANYGVLLTEPYTRKIKGKLRELRITDRQGKSESSILLIQIGGSFFFMVSLREQEKHRDEISRFLKKD